MIDAESIQIPLEGVSTSSPQVLFPAFDPAVRGAERHANTGVFSRNGAGDQEIVTEVEYAPDGQPYYTTEILPREYGLGNSRTERDTQFQPGVFGRYLYGVSFGGVAVDAKVQVVYRRREWGESWQPNITYLFEDPERPGQVTGAVFNGMELTSEGWVGDYNWPDWSVLWGSQLAVLTCDSISSSLHGLSPAGDGSVHVPDEWLVHSVFGDLAAYGPRVTERRQDVTAYYLGEVHVLAEDELWGRRTFEHECQFRLVATAARYTRSCIPLGLRVKWNGGAYVSEVILRPWQPDNTSVDTTIHTLSAGTRKQLTSVEYEFFHPEQGAG